MSYADLDKRVLPVCIIVQKSKKVWTTSCLLPWLLSILTFGKPLTTFLYQKMGNKSKISRLLPILLIKSHVVAFYICTITFCGHFSAHFPQPVHLE